MRVGVNCLQIDPSYTGGVNTFTFGLLDGFAKQGNGDCFQLYVHAGNQHLFEQYRSQPGWKVAVVNDSLLPMKRRLSRVTLLATDRAFYKRASDLLFGKIQREMEADSDILYTPTVVLQSFNSRKPTVLSMHDIQHVHYPEFFSWGRRLSRKITYGLSASHANWFQASSEFIKQDLLAHFRELAPQQIAVIAEGVNIADFSTPIDNDSCLDRYDLPDRFLFYPAQLWPHKNHITVLKALKEIETLHGVKIPLVLTGAAYSAAAEILEFVKQRSLDYVIYLGKVPFEELVGLYQRAAYLITAVLYESSSQPILEAAAAGTAIIASKTPPNVELSRVLKLNLFEPLDVEGLARMIHRLWNDEQVADLQIAHNRHHIGAYSWENTARQYVDFFETVLNE
jgi:glycosyltransferase involved in cell wall biosynthesis